MSVYSGHWRYGTFPLAVASVPLGPSPLYLPAGSRVSESETYVLALTPFVFIASTTRHDNLGLDISEWTTWEYDRRPREHQRYLDVPTVDTNHPAIRALLYPADYVSADSSRVPLECT